MAAAEGYFSARIDVKIDRAADPVAVTLVVDPGAPTRIASVRIVVTGPAADAPLGTEAIARLTRDWGLPEGDVFRQAGMVDREGARAGHARGQPLRGGAHDAQRSRDRSRAREARDLVVEFASGPAFHFGEFEISGLQKYDAFAGQELQHDHARRAVQRRRAEPVRATAQRIGLLRERAGEDRYRRRRIPTLQRSTSR